MTSKQFLDAFSETLMQDERILSSRERELLMSILQNSRTTVSNSDPETQAAVTAAISRSVGETVAQRAFALLGGNILGRILADSESAASDEETMPSVAAHQSPQPPSAKKPMKGPQPPNAPGPGIKRPLTEPPGPQPPNAPQPPMGNPLGPQPPNSGPQPPNAVRPQTVTMQSGEESSGSHGVGVLESPAIVRAQCVVLDEFLAPQELDELVSYTLQHEKEFQTSEVISPAAEGVTDYDHRRSRVLLDLGKHENVVLERIRRVLPSVLDQLGIEDFPVTRTEAQITASNDGDFFGAHSDDSHEKIASRRLTFVYFFHCEPHPFEGGELRVHDSCEGEAHVGAGSYQMIVPRQNQIVFFPCSVSHEITPVECPSRAFADSRFTLNGWLHK